VQKAVVTAGYKKIRLLTLPHRRLAFNNDNLAAKSSLPAAVLDCRDLGAALRQCKLWR